MDRPETQASVLLLNLSGNDRAARDWAARHFDEFQTLNKAELKWLSKGQALDTMRRLAPETILLFTGDLALQSARGAMLLFAAMAGAKRIIFADERGRVIERSRWSAFAIEAPRLGLELAYGYLILFPLSWLLTLAADASLWFRAVRRQESRVRESRRNGQTALYIRATLTSVREGGMATHVAGFAGGARQGGHRLIFLVSDDAKQPVAGEDAQQNIAPSATFSATRAIFELWNNLVFTGRAVAWFRDRAPAVDFLYQRYSRFNWTGAVLSILSGLPLALEFNGSEVWVSQKWDPVGQLPLLRRFEKLSLRAADLIFTVSEVERRNLIAAGVAEQKIIANPNGVDVEQFRATGNGAEVRRRLGVEGKITVGFLGTFGPWHGAPVLAEAASMLPESCHLLFIGDGDERAACEERLAAAKDRATFVGRIPHDRVPDYLDACDILVSPHVASADGSEFFGSPTKLFEYLAMQKPVVASRLGQIGDIIVDGETGLLVEPGDADALASAVTRLAEDADLRARLSDAARHMVTERFTWRHNAARVFDAVGRMEKTRER